MVNKSARNILFLLILPAIFAGSFCYNATQMSLPALEKAIQNPKLKSAHWGLVVLDLDSGKNIISENETKNFIPASLTKLFTTAAVLHLLGENYQFETEVLAEIESLKGGILYGALTLKGTGDPTLTSKDLNQLAKDLKSKGIKRIVGKIEASGFKYNEATLLPHAEWEDLTWDYAPEVQGLSVDGNALTLHITPAKDPGIAALVECSELVPCMNILNLTVTTADEKNDETSIKITRGFNDNRVILSGAIPLSHPGLSERIAIHEPADYAKKILIESLKKEGIAYEAKVRLYAGKSSPEKLAFHLSPPLKEIVQQMNKFSHNLTAELLIQTASYEREKEASPSAIHAGKPAFDFMREWGGFEKSSFELTGGAGISRHNSVRPQDVADLLKKMYTSPFRKTLLDSLPIAGVDGTLANRFKGTIAENNLRGKTGTLKGVSALAGYAQTKSQKNICFCLIVNHHLEKSENCRNEMDNLIVSYLEKL